MNQKEFNKSFVANLEKQRHALGLTQVEMASQLGLSISSYKRMLNGEAKHIDIYLSYKMYMLTQKLTYEMIDYSDELVDVVSNIKTLSPDELKVVIELINLLINRREK